MNFNFKVITGCAIALGTMVLVGILSYRSTAREDVDRGWVTHTHMVIEKIDIVFTDLLEAETGQRGYSLTGSEPLLEPYRRSKAHVSDDIKQLRSLIADNPGQQHALDELEPMIQAQIARFQSFVDRKREHVDATFPAEERITTNVATVKIQSALLAMREAELQLLEKRSKTAEANSKKTKAVIISGNLLAVFFLLLAGIIIYREMARRQKAEQVIRDLNTGLEERVAERTADLEERTNELARSNHELQQFAYVASHDLQEPLRMVASFTQLLGKRYRDKLDDDARDFINFAVDGATRMQSLISDLLSYSRVGTQGKTLESTSMETTLKRVLSSLRMAIQESHATITHDLLPTVLADEVQLGQLLQNLLTNAMKFKGESDPCIHISAEKNGKAWKIGVRDNGIGIPLEQGDRIFVIFQRLHTREQYPGTGIGLAICKKIVERHGGRIWIEPAPGGGTIFFFTFPVMGEIHSREEASNVLRTSA